MKDDEKHTTDKDEKRIDERRAIVCPLPFPFPHWEEKLQEIKETDHRLILVYEYYCSIIVISCNL